MGQKQAAFSAINMAFLAGNPRTTNMSSIYFLPYTNFSTRSGFIVTPNVWLADNRWNLNGDLRITKNENDTYGIGANTSSSVKSEVDYKYARIVFTANRNSGAFHAGLGFAMDYYYDVKVDTTGRHVNVLSSYGIGAGRKQRLLAFRSIV